MSSTQEPAGIEIDPGALADWMTAADAPEVIDVREPHEREAGYIDGSRHVPMLELATEAKATHERPIVFYCRVGARSQMAAEAFRASGIAAYTMNGGLLRWAAEDRPLAPEHGRVAEH
jgi:rhodanese-related sulfurtransferase